MEFAEHGCMLDYMNSRGPLSEERGHGYFSRLVSALDCLHNLKFIEHHNLKAENAFLDRTTTSA
jgi:serine/threonine protein kinase